MRTKRQIVIRILAAAALGVASIAGVGSRAATPKFYPDDPIWHDPETQDAVNVKPLPISDQYDYLENSYLGAGDRADKRALNMNSVDEVPDSSWFTNRIGQRAMTDDALARGPDTGSGPTGTWTIIAAKTEGVTPGFTIRDAAGQVYFVKFDPPSNPEMASGAEVIATKFLYAFGYHVPENYLATLRRDALVVDPGATVNEGLRQRRMRARDVDEVLKKAAQSSDGTYRALASKALEGTSVGPFRYYGTRPDDPNDIFAHEHRRELRGLSVFAAWLNHNDSRAGNTLDTLIRQGGRTILRHHLIDFGSAFGSGSTRAGSPRAGNEYIWESRPTLITMLTLGLYVRPWVKVEYPDLPAIGRFESTYFRPEAWKPEYANVAFLNARPEDRFWAARIVAAVPENAVRTMVKTAQFSDPHATEYMIDTILARRSKILKSWLNGTNPIVSPSLQQDGTLTFTNAAEDAGVGPAADHFTIQWSNVDNASGALTSIGQEQTFTERRVQAPASVISGQADFVAAQVRAFHPDQPGWSQPLTIYFRRTTAGFTLVGLERG
jgi:hypothetical protein